ncbi:TRAP transporter small permease [Oricola sp.]|uniref:TRAP transporter small permease n=1 Tax=Oricola sp. TaxID=1979950 RepID=UPI0025D29230|nr:TRAP transporter small permease [Oricola sp.]MCI5076587.1 TRAP transporter small permease [Oricola sp.]
MLSFLHALGRQHDRLTRLGAVISALCLGGIVVLYGGEIVTRHFLHSPTSWSSAVAVYLLLATVMLMLPSLTMNIDHVAVSIAEEHFTPRYAFLSAAAVLAISAAICFLSAFFSLSETMRAFTRGTLTTDTLFVPKWWLLSLVVYGLTSATIHFIRHLCGLVARDRHLLITNGRETAQ